MSAAERTAEERAVARKTPSSAPAGLSSSVALVTVALTYWSIDILAPALPAIQDDLGLSAAGAGLIFSLLFLGRLVGNLPAAFLVERAGTALTTALGGLLLTAGSLLAAVAPGGLVLFPARLVQGVGIALLVNAALRSVLLAKPGRGAAMTYFGFAATVGGILGLQSGGFLTDASGWRAVFVLCVALAAVITVGGLASRATGPSRAAPETERAEVARAGRPSGSVVAALVFNFLVFVNYGIWVTLPLYTEQAFDASAETNANLLLIITVMHLIAAFPAGRAIRRWGAHRALAVGMVLSLLGTAAIAPAPSAVWIAAPLVLYGIGQVAASSAGGDIVLHLGGGSGRAVGQVRFSSDLGLVIGPYLTGVLSDAFGYRTPFYVLPAMTAVAAVMAFRQAPGRERPFP